MKSSRFLSMDGLKRIYPPCIIIIIWGLFILPSAFDPNWFYLDDPTTLLGSKSLASNFHIPRPDGVTGRYFPAYWLYYALLFNFFGFHLTGYYAVQALMFLLTLLLVYSIVIKTTRSRCAGLLAAFLVATASPVAENIYTFGKAEPKVLFYLLCVLYLFIFTENATQKGKTARLVSSIGMTLFITVAILTKETAIVFFVFAAAGAAIGWSLNKNSNGNNNYNIKPYLFLLAGSVCAVLFARGLFYALRPSLSLNSYTSYSMNQEVFLDNLKFYANQQPDVLFLGLITAVLTAISYIKKSEENSKNFIFAGSLFITGLAYMLGLLIWRKPVAYYLLVPASFFSIAIVIMVWSFFRPSISNWKGYVIVALILMPCLYSIPYFAFIAHAQKAQGKIYTEAMGYYMQVAKPGERLLVEELPFFAESVTQSNILLKRIFGKEHLSVEGLQDIIHNVAIPSETLKLYQVLSAPETNTRHPRENDYILTLTGNRQSPWVLRGISPFLNEKGSAYKMRGLELEHVRTTNIQWSGLELTVPFIHPKLRTYSAGYSLYKVNNPLLPVMWEGRWADGWISSKALCSLRVSKQKKEKFTFNGFVTKYTTPSLLTIINNKKIIKKVMLNKAGPFSFTLEISSAEKNDFVYVEFNAEKTFNPKNLGLNNDNRNLSVLIKVLGIEG